MENTRETESANRIFIERHGKHFIELQKIMKNINDPAETLPFLITSVYIMTKTYIEEGRIPKDKAVIMMEELCNILLEDIGKIK